MLRAGLYGAVAGAIAIVSVAGAQEEAAKARFEESKKALADVKAMQFEIKTKTTGMMFTIEIEGQAAMLRTEGGRWLARFSGETNREELPTYDVIVDGDFLTWTDHEAKQVKTRPSRAARHPQIQLGRRYGFIPQLLEAEPFTSMPGKITSMEITGEEVVAGEPCDVIKLTMENNQTYTWCISKKDNLPRKLTHALPEAFETTQVVSKLRPDAKIATDYFEMIVPEGYQKSATAKPGNVPTIEEGTVTAGRINNASLRAAPGFELSTIDGKTVTLESMRGDVVLIEFIATRSGASRRVGKELKPFLEKHPEIKLISVPVFERERADTEAYFKERGIDGTVCIEGDAVADQYGANAFPRYVLVSGEGTIIGESGLKPDSEFGELSMRLEKYRAGELGGEQGADSTGSGLGTDGGG